MSVGVVHILEMVDVDKDDAKCLSKAVCSVDFLFNRPVHITAVRQLRQFIRSRNQIQFFISLFKFVSAFLDFFFKQFSVLVQFFDLSLDGRVHLVENSSEAADFVLAAFGLEFTNVEVPFGNLGNVVNQVVQRLTDNQDLPKRHEQDGDNRTEQNDLADMVNRRNHCINFCLRL